MSYSKEYVNVIANCKGRNLHKY